MKSGTITRFFIILLLFTGIAQLLGDDKDERIHSLHRDIILLNLVNGLYLTPDQTHQLLNKIEEAEKARIAFKSGMKKISSELESTLDAVRVVLLEGTEIPDNLKKQVHQVQQKRHRLDDRQSEILCRLESEVEALLSPNQMEVIADYNPCIVPPAQGKIGQSVEAAAEGIVRAMTRFRRLLPNQYEMAKEMFIDFHMKKYNRVIGFQNEQESDVYRLMVNDILDKSYDLSDKEFMLEKASLAQSLIPEKIKTRKPKKNQLGRTGRFLLDPALIPLLESTLHRS